MEQQDLTLNLHDLTLDFEGQDLLEARSESITRINTTLVHQNQVLQSNTYQDNKMMISNEAVVDSDVKGSDSQFEMLNMTDMQSQISQNKFLYQEYKKSCLTSNEASKEERQGQQSMRRVRRIDSRDLLLFRSGFSSQLDAQVQSVHSILDTSIQTKQTIMDSYRQNPVHIKQLFNLVLSEESQEQVKLMVHQLGVQAITSMCNQLGQSLLHVACMRNSLAYVKLLVNFVQQPAIQSDTTSHITSLRMSPSNKRLTSDIGKETLLRWINATTLLDQKQDYSALHIACRIGNLEMVKFLLANGANIQQKSTNEVTCLHIAAQGDHPRIIHFLLSQKYFWIDRVDANRCTALHWACLEGSYQAVRYLLANGANVNLTSHQENFTPLHIAFQSLDYAQDTRIVYKICVYGADFGAKDIYGKTAADYIVNMDDFSLQQEVQTLVKSLEEDSQGLFNCKCKRKSGQKFQRDPWLARMLGSWLVLTSVMNFFLVLLPSLNLLEEYGWSLSQKFSISLIVGNLLALITFLLITFKSPGALKRSSAELSPTWNESMESVHFTMTCPECQIIKVPRSRHCYLCGTCVSVFDHHCEWINQCIGGHNNVCFLFFIVCLIGNMVVTASVEVFLAYAAANCDYFGGTSCWEIIDGKPQNDSKTYWAISIVGIQSVVYISFFVPVSALLLVQIQNFYLGLTTNERFGRDALKIDEQAFGKTNKFRLQTVNISVLESEVKYLTCSFTQGSIASASVLGQSIGGSLLKGNKSMRQTNDGSQMNLSTMSQRRFQQRKTPTFNVNRSCQLCYYPANITQRDLYIDYKRQLREYQSQRFGNTADFIDV